MPIAKINPVYTAEVTVTGGRHGHAVSTDGALDLKLASPGAKGDLSATNPEQLFAAAYAACYQDALASHAKRARLDASESTVTAAVSLGKEAGGAYGLAVTLTVRMPGVDSQQARELANGALETCPYSRATRGNIEVTIVVE